MHREPIPAPAVDDETIDAGILGLLLNPTKQRPWSVDEVAREIGNNMAVADGLARLYGAGLIHRLDGFVFATRSAVRGDQIEV
jgi:hypothetical protein